MGRILQVILILLYFSATAFVIYRNVYQYDIKFNKHLRACLDGVEPSQIFRVTDPMMEKLHPKISYEKWYQTVPPQLKIVYIAAYYVGMLYRIWCFWWSLVYTLLCIYVLNIDTGPDPAIVQGKVNLLLIESTKLFLPFTTMSF